MNCNRFQINPVVSCGEETDGAVLFNPDTDNTAAINLSGLMLWHFLQTPRTISEMCSYLANQYPDIPTSQTMADVTGFIETLKPDFLLETDNQPL